MKQFKYLIMTIICMLFLSGCSSDSVQKYTGTEDIETEHHTQEKLAKISVRDTYTKDGITYYEISTTATDNTYTYTEQEYDEIFGLENDAFDCEIYSLSMTSDIIKHTNRNVFDYLFDNQWFEPMKNTFYKLLNNNEDIAFTDGYSIRQLISPSSEADDYMKLICETYSDDDVTLAVYLKRNSQNQLVYSTLYSTRYSFLGESDFTEEEIDGYRKELDEVNRYILSMYEEEAR